MTASPATVIAEHERGSTAYGCSCGGYCPSCQSSTSVQMKLNVTSADDLHEREADRVADQVVSRQPVSVQAAWNAQDPQRNARHPTGAVKAIEHPVRQDLLPNAGEQLDSATHRELASRMGQDFSQVRIHRDAKAALVAKQFGARAFTLGNHIAFSSGEYNPGTTEGKRLLAHELTHVVQQRDGPMLQRKVFARSGLSIDNYLITKGVNFRKTASHYRGVTVDRSNLDKEILTTMLLSPRSFFIAGATQPSVDKNLDDHVAARKRIVGYTALKNYQFAVGSNIKMNTNLWAPGGTGYDVRKGENKLKAYLDLIQSGSYAVSCHIAAKATMLAGTQGQQLTRDKIANAHDWIPGDWGYIQNATFHRWINNEGEEGENIIYTGNNYFWGHISNSNTYKTMSGWLSLVKKWGVARLRAWRDRPGNGLT